jgi:CRISPR-associated protein Cas2
MRLLVLFDLPTKAKSEQRQATQFRNHLLKDGFSMLQFSVYCRVCRGLDTVDKHIARLQKKLPLRGNVRVLIITERQYERMIIVLGLPKKEEKIGSEQLLLF